MSDELKIAHTLAVKARENAYAPYSQFKVGVALKFKDHPEWFSGCNVENVTNGASACAEYGALMKAICAVGGEKKLETVVVTTDSKLLTPPCGKCLQFLNEFAEDKTKIYLSDLEGIKKDFEFSQLLPYRYEKGKFW